MLDRYHSNNCSTIVVMARFEPVPQIIMFKPEKQFLTQFPTPRRRLKTKKRNLVFYLLTYFLTNFEVFGTLTGVFNIASHTMNYSWRKSNQKSSPNFMIINPNLHGSDSLCSLVMNCLEFLKKRKL